MDSYGQLWTVMDTLPFCDFVSLQCEINCCLTKNFRTMSKAYKVVKRKVMFDPSRPIEGYTVVPVNYGLLTTAEVAEQIAAESSATPGDVKNVLDRYAFYVKQNLAKGYAIELLGFGRLSIRFIKGRLVDTSDKANATMVKGMVPKFTPSFTVINGARKYHIMPDKVQLVKFNGLVNMVDGSEGDGTNTDQDSGGTIL